VTLANATLKTTRSEAKEGWLTTRPKALLEQFFLTLSAAGATKDGLKVHVRVGKKKRKMTSSRPRQGQKGWNGTLSRICKPLAAESRRDGGHLGGFGEHLDSDSPLLDMVGAEKDRKRESSAEGEKRREENTIRKQKGKHNFRNRPQKWERKKGERRDKSGNHGGKRPSRKREVPDEGLKWPKKEKIRGKVKIAGVCDQAKSDKRAK